MKKIIYVILLIGAVLFGAYLSKEYLSFSVEDVIPDVSTDISKAKVTVPDSVYASVFGEESILTEAKISYTDTLKYYVDVDWWPDFKLDLEYKAVIEACTDLKALIIYSTPDTIEVTLPSATNCRHINSGHRVIATYEGNIAHTNQEEMVVAAVDSAQVLTEQESRIKKEKLKSLSYRADSSAMATMIKLYRPLAAIDDRIVIVKINNFDNFTFYPNTTEFKPNNIR